MFRFLNPAHTTTETTQAIFMHELNSTFSKRARFIAGQAVPNVFGTRKVTFPSIAVLFRRREKPTERLDGT